jgi:hypothetical protein
MIPFTSTLHCTKQWNTYSGFYSSVTTKLMNRNTYFILASSHTKCALIFFLFSVFNANVSYSHSLYYYIIKIYP